MAMTQALSHPLADRSSVSEDAEFDARQDKPTSNACQAFLDLFLDYPTLEGINGGSTAVCRPWFRRTRRGSVEPGLVPLNHGWFC